MYKIAAIGDKDSIYGFASIGLEIYPIDNASDAINRIRQKVEGG